MPANYVSVFVQDQYWPVQPHIFHNILECKFLKLSYCLGISPTVGFLNILASLVIDSRKKSHVFKAMLQYVRVLCASCASI